MNMDHKAALGLVMESMGIHPMSITENGVTTHRDGFGDGWNAAVMEITRKYVDIAKALEEYEENH